MANKPDAEQRFAAQAARYTRREILHEETNLRRGRRRAAWIKKSAMGAAVEAAAAEGVRKQGGWWGAAFFAFFFLGLFVDAFGEFPS